jgi:hypothetical protein
MALTDNLIAFWELEEASGTRVDAHGANDLTDNNTVLSGTGKVGTAADFEASSSESLSIADNTDLSMGVNQSFTINCWMNFESLPGNSAPFGKYDEYGIQEISGQYLRFRVWPSTGFPTPGEIDDNAAGLLSTGTWYMVTVGYDATADEVFISRNAGTRYTTGSVTSGAYDGTNDFNLGMLGSGILYFDGLLDQCGVWKRALTTGEVTSLYNGGSGLSYAAMGGGGGANHNSLSLLGVG